MCQRRADRVIVTHGTDTIIQTGNFLDGDTKDFLNQTKKCIFNSIHHFSEKIRQSKRDDLLIILTGSFLPESFKNSDADFNIGLAIGNIEHLRVPQEINTSFVHHRGIIGFEIWGVRCFERLCKSKNTKQIFCTK